MPAKDAREFAAAVTMLLRDNVKAKVLGQNARLFVEENYSWEAKLKRLDDLLEDRPNSAVASLA